MKELHEAYPSHLRDLNPPQLEAVKHFEGPILVLAGAGSGKTRVLTRRVANLVLTHHVNPWNILAITFTNKATDEMRQRLSGMLGERAAQLWVSTFHAAGLKILRRNARYFGYEPNFTVYDDKDSKALLKSVLKECSIDEKKHPVQHFARAIDSAKNRMVEPADYLERGSALNNYELHLQAEVYDRYQKALLKAQAMDFGDLLLNAVLLLERSTEVREHYQRLLRFVLVDEFQDTNQVQYRFIRLITEPHHNLLVVGDDDQSIYAFRGATIQNILNFERDYPECKVVKLEQNYRSTSNILEAAHSIIRHNKARKGKKLWTSEAAGDPIFTFAASDETEEAEFIAWRIEEQQKKGCSLNEMAVFYRVNAQSRAIEESLVNHSIPYKIFGGQKFYERKEVKDILSYLRLLINEADDQAFLRVINTPPRGIGAQALQNVVKLAEERRSSLLAAARAMGDSNKHVRKFVVLMDQLKEAAAKVFLGELIARAVEDSDYGPKLKAMKDVTAQSRIENLQELAAIGRSMESQDEDHLETLSRFLDRVSLTAGDEAPNEEAAERTGPVNEKKEYVTLMTLHLAKGLEFPVVFMAGLEEGLLPHYHSIYEADGIEEERRLCYVGITRARKTLYLTRAFTRGMFAGGSDLGGYREASRFAYDLPEELVEHLDSPY